MDFDMAIAPDDEILSEEWGTSSIISPRLDRTQNVLYMFSFTDLGVLPR
jgi:hypothetical protein